MPRAALASLHEAASGWALACAGRRSSDATDILQDTYERILSGRARFEGRSTLKTWLFGIIRVVAREHARRRVVQWLFPERAAQSAVPPSAASPESAAAAAEQRRRIAEALAELSPRQREVVHLVFYEDLTLEEAALVMGVSVGSARVHYDRGKREMAILLERRGFER